MTLAKLLNYVPQVLPIKITGSTSKGCWEANILSHVDKRVLTRPSKAVEKHRQLLLKWGRTEEHDEKINSEKHTLCI